MAKKQREIERWITVNGARVPIFKGQSAEDAVKEFVEFAKKKSPGKSEEGVKPYAVSQPTSVLGEKQASRMEIEYTRSKEEAVSKYKEKYPKAKNIDVEESKAPEHTKKAAEINAANKTVRESRPLSSKHDFQKAIRDAKTKEEIMNVVKEAGNVGLSKEAMDKVMGDAHDKAQSLKKTISDNEALKEKQIAANKAQAQAARGKRGSTPEFKSYEEVREYYQKRFSEMSPQNMNRIARNMQIGGRGKEKIAALAEAKAKEWSKGKNDAAKGDKQIGHTAKRTTQADAGAKKDRMQVAADAINKISVSHNNRGGKEDDWKQVRDILQKAPVGTVMEQTGERGVKFQYEKIGEDRWKNTDPKYAYESDSKTLSMSWTGYGHRPLVNFTTKDKALTREQVKAAQDAATTGRLNQVLGLDKNGKKITRASMAGTGISKESVGAMSNVYDGGKKTSTKTKDSGSYESNPTKKELIEKILKTYDEDMKKKYGVWLKRQSVEELLKIFDERRKKS